MRKIAIALLALGLFAASTASAASFWSETFTYANGGLVAVSGGNWTNHSGTGTDIQVVNGEAVVNSANAPDDNRTFTAQPSGSTTYACFRMKIALTAAPAAAGAYFCNFKDTGTFNFQARVFVGPDGTSTTSYKLGINASGNTPTYWATPLVTGTYYTVAIRYNASTNSATLWVDPQSEASTSVTQTTGGTTVYVPSAFALRQASGYGVATVDNIQVGDNFGDLCPNPTPTSSQTWGQLKSLYR
jgi:hypothetical protein